MTISISLPIAVLIKGFLSVFPLIYPAIYPVYISYQILSVIIRNEKLYYCANNTTVSILRLNSEGCWRSIAGCVCEWRKDEKNQQLASM